MASQRLNFQRSFKAEENEKDSGGEEIHTSTGDCEF